jgi:hypothetical protein
MLREIVDTYIPNAIYRIKVFFNPSIKKEVDEFINAVEKEANNYILHKKKMEK